MAHVDCDAGVESSVGDSTTVGSNERASDEVLEEAGERRMLCAAVLEDFAQSLSFDGDKNEAGRVIFCIEESLLPAPNIGFMSEKAGAYAEERRDGCGQLGCEKRR